MLIDRARALPPDSTQAKRATKQAQTTQRVEDAADEFEAIFLTQMLEHMFTGVGDDDPLKGPGDEIYRSMMLQEYGKMMTKAGGIGVADHVKRELLRTQEIDYDTGPHRHIARPDHSH